MHTTHNPSPKTRNPAEKHAFSSKERDVETGLSYFGARYYSSDLSIWLSVDPKANKYPSLNPYTYCANNPVKLVDPNGEEIGNYYDWNGHYLGWDGCNDDNVHFVQGKTAKLIKKAKGSAIDPNQVEIDVTTNKRIIQEILGVSERTMENGETKEEATFITTKGRYTGQGPDVSSVPIDRPAYAEIQYEGDVLVSIHSHLPFRKIPNSDEIYSNSAFRPSEDADKLIKANLNVITGPLGDTEWYASSNGGGFWQTPERGAVFYDENWNRKGAISIVDLRKTIK